ncbi:unnamed protein product [Sphenostylis stenocarpa]|uniref:Uncharacterized protein n=1 Tax=Sphenostylis stenocarpa TaxID=92480 RepID=A0AA86VM47_9FABA|nr:unnamed protein product [Sphenostylis stenocarpa]
MDAATGTNEEVITNYVANFEECVMVGLVREAAPSSIGDVAQMVERSLSMREVRGSIPRISIILYFHSFKLWAKLYMALCEEEFIKEGPLSSIGDVAQMVERSLSMREMVERSLSMREVRGSIPRISKILFRPVTLTPILLRK